MFLDEELVREELRRKVKPDDKETRERLEAEIRQQEEDQKSVNEFVDELKVGTVVIDGQEYHCEKEERLYVFPEDVEKIVRNDQSVVVSYKTLEMGINLMSLTGQLVIRNEDEYQKQMKKHFRDNNVPYYPVDTGNLRSGKTKICYATGITTSPIGGIYALHFFYKTKSGFVTGSYTCRLLKRFSFEHLFLAMLQIMCEEGT